MERSRSYLKRVSQLELSNEKRIEILNQLKSIAEYYISKNDGEREYAGTVQTEGHMTDGALTADCGRTSFESFVRVYAYKSDKTKKCIRYKKYPWLLHFVF